MATQEERLQIVEFDLKYFKTETIKADGDTFVARTMVPDALTNFFVASAGTGATLPGLLFVSLSISPEEKITLTLIICLN